MPQPLEVRVSDDERERVAAEIREHFAQGRLDVEELSDRLERVYAARTRRDLDAARAELPALAEAPGAELAARRTELRRRLVQQTGASLTPFLVCTVIWLLGGASGGFWPAWIALFAVIPLLRNGWRLYGPAPELDRVAEELEGRRPT